jgi:hypothetical protein
MATAVAGGGFLLHCVFVITVSSLKHPNIVFSFIGKAIFATVAINAIRIDYN